MDIKKMLDTVGDVIGYIKDFGEKEYDQLSDRLEGDLRYTIEAVNRELLCSSKVQFCRLDELDKRRGEAGYKQGAIARYASWLDQITEILV